MATELLEKTYKGLPCPHRELLLCQEGYCSECDVPNKRILLDVDGCITTYDFTALVWKHFKVDITGLAISAYDLADLLGVSNLAIDAMFKDVVWGEPDFNEGALETLRDWKQKGYELVIHSGRVNYMGEIGLVSWLVDNEIPFSGIDTTGRARKYDVQIDDRPSKLANATSRNKLLFDSPWNKKCFDILGQFKRVYNWVEIRRIVEGIIKNENT